MEIGQTKVSDLNISIRCYNSLRGNNIATVSDLLEMVCAENEERLEWTQLYKIRGFGRRSLYEMLDALCYILFNKPYKDISSSEYNTLHSATTFSMKKFKQKKQETNQANLMNTSIVIQLSIEELTSLIRDAVRAELANYTPPVPKHDLPEYLTRHETAKQLKHRAKAPLWNKKDQKPN